MPAYCSITIGYNPQIISFKVLKEKIQSLFKGKETGKSIARVLNIPVCYEAPFSLDFDEIKRKTGLSTEEIIKQHTETSYRVYMIGFLPGFTYMGKLKETLFCPRKNTPRIRVPERSVGIAGFQTGIYPLPAPGGWQIIGKTPLNIFRIENKTPCLFKAGDTVLYYRITQREYHLIRKEIVSDSFKIESIYG